MCQYNFLILENKTIENGITEVANTSGFHFQSVMTNLSIPKLNTYVTDLGEDNCNCGSVIGNSAWKEEKIIDIEKEKKKFKRKRYSKTRIEQLLQQKQQEIVLEKLKLKAQNLKKPKNGLSSYRICRMESA